MNNEVRYVYDGEKINWSNCVCLGVGKMVMELIRGEYIVAKLSCTIDVGMMVKVLVDNIQYV